MPTQQALARARKDKREGKLAGTQAGAFMGEEIERVREGAHGARSPAQAIAIRLSQAQRAGVEIPEKKGGKVVRRKVEPGAKPSPRRSRAALDALKHETADATSSQALSQHARAAAAERAPSDRSASTREAGRTKGPAKRKAASRKAARTRGGNRASGAARAARTRTMRARGRG